VLSRFSSALYHPADLRKHNHNLWTDLQLARRLRGESGVVIASRPGHNILIADLALPGLVTVGLEQMNLGSHAKNLRRAMVRRYRELDGLAVLTEQDRGEYTAAMNGSAPPMWRIPNTVREIEPPQADMSAKRILAAGRYTPQKGFDYLIHAFAPVAEAHPDWELVIFGSGRSRERLQDRIDTLGIGEQATLAGPTEDVPGEMARSSIYVLSSRFEGFPLVLIEAMSKGMAVVAFDCPTGPADIVDDHRNGLLVPAKDVEGLTAAIMEMVGDEDLRRRCAGAAVETARDYTMAAIGPKWDEMLQELVRRRQSAA
jgi:glycosyltransferase involved in cell wall biosynthesis